MNFLQKLISSTYSFRMKISKMTGLGIQSIENKNKVPAKESFYSLKATSNSGEIVLFDQFKNKKVLLVNLASQCGYTPQYTELQQLHQNNTDLVILGFPANNFGAQEPGNNSKIAEFCQINFGVTFPLFEKNDVKGPHKQSVYNWLTDKNKNGWNELEPKWNFYKYLIDKDGNLSGVYSSSVSPQDIDLM